MAASASGNSAAGLRNQIRLVGVYGQLVGLRLPLYPKKIRASKRSWRQTGRLSEGLREATKRLAETCFSVNLFTNWSGKTGKNHVRKHSSWFHTSGFYVHAYSWLQVHAYIEHAALHASTGFLTELLMSITRAHAMWHGMPQCAVHTAVQPHV
jgi:hypothetical protein